jgi:hypothetical protein
MHLPDYKPNLSAPLKFRDLNVVVLQATFASGSATIDATNSSPSVTISAGSGSVYAVTVPPGQFGHIVGCHLDNKDSTPDAIDAHIAVPVNYDASLGTLSIAVLATDDGLVADPDDTARLYLTLLIGRA